MPNARFFLPGLLYLILAGCQATHPQAPSQCVPTSCQAQGKDCGSIPDGCGATLDCGACTAPQTCAATGVANLCGCVPTTCSVEGKNCGSISDGCGATLNCGTCAAPQTCAANVCGCVPTTCAAQGKNCGTIPNGCGATLDCGACTAPQTCAATGTANLCGCVPTTCAAQGKNCGSISDGCGATLNCGACTAPQTCAATGTANLCGCVPTTCAAQGKNCGALSDGCGLTLNCGACTAPQTCAGTGAANVCGCAPSSCAAQGKNCGTITDGCGASLNCGATCSVVSQYCGPRSTNVCDNFQIGGAGPWPLVRTTYGFADGILEYPVVGMSTDEYQNQWVATPVALYLMRPGQTTFHRYTAADGLHLQSNPVYYDDSHISGRPADVNVPGAALDPGITEIVGGGPDEVFVGYKGYDNGTGTFNISGSADDPYRHSGKLDRVRLRDDGTLQVDRIDMSSGNHGGQYWHNQSVERMVYDHYVHKHELYVGTNHGVDLIRPDLMPSPIPTLYNNEVNLTFMADHLHPRVCDGAPCTSIGGGEDGHQLIGDWRGLSLSTDGQLWVAGRWAAGEIKWDASLANWFGRSGSQAFTFAFGDPYQPPTSPTAPGYFGEPVFRPTKSDGTLANEGATVSLTAVSVAPDGRVWFASGNVYSTDKSYGIAVWDGKTFTTYDPTSAAVGMTENRTRDLIVLPDGRIVLAGFTTGLVLWNPATGAHTALNHAAGWIPDDNILRIELDAMVMPPALHVSTNAGAAVIRNFPP